MEVAETTVTLVAGRLTEGLTAVPPDSSTKLTVAPVKKPVPLIVTDVPPAVDPDVGVRPVTVGGVDAYVKLLLYELVPPDVVTVTK
jgi:hypothetical protein